jgi:hypothetical protein
MLPGRIARALALSDQAASCAMLVASTDLGLARSLLKRW